MVVQLGGVLLGGQLLLMQALVEVVNQEVLVLLDPFQLLCHAISSIGLPAKPILLVRHSVSQSERARGSGRVGALCIAGRVGQERTCGPQRCPSSSVRRASPLAAVWQS